MARGLEATGAGPISASAAASTAHRHGGAAARAHAARHLAELLQTDELRAALGRIACRYDGGLPD